MKYIKRITLNNFQSHKHSTIDLDERLNVIVGPSDSGKSAIIRGIKWVLYNEPSGDYFIREGEKECCVTLEFSDNTILKRYRSRSKNQYILINSNGEETKFEGFGSNIPEQIVETIGMKKIHLDSDESNSINLGEQLEGAFLLSEKSSTRASAIGRLVGVNIIDDALRDVLKDSRGLNITKKHLEESTLKLKEEINKYDYLDDLREKLNMATNIKNKISEYSSKLERMKKIIDILNEIKIEKNETVSTLKKLQVTDELNTKINEIENNLLRHRYYNRYNNNLNKIKEDTSEYSLLTDKLKNLDFAYNNMDKLSSKYDRFIKLSQIQKKQALYNYEIVQHKKILTDLKNVDVISYNLDKVAAIATRLSKLSYYNETYSKIKKSLVMGESYINNLINVEKVDIKLNILDEKLKILTILTKYYKLILTISKDIKIESSSINDVGVNIKKQLEEYQNLLKKLEICPYCLSDINEDKISHIINHYIGG